ncbi:MAG: hypothetical protein ACPLPS_06505, partial [bacterium]
MDNESKEKKFPSYRGVPDAVWRGVLKFFVIARSEATKQSKTRLRRGSEGTPRNDKKPRDASHPFVIARSGAF